MDVNEKCLKPKPGYFETTDPDTGNPITKSTIFYYYYFIINI